MSLATRCTACGTVFRVVQDQLKVSEGWVRCGKCQEVFSAMDGLFDLDAKAAAAAPAGTGSGFAPSPAAGRTDVAPSTIPAPYRSGNTLFDQPFFTPPEKPASVWRGKRGGGESPAAPPSSDPPGSTSMSASSPSIAATPPAAWRHATPAFEASAADAADALQIQPLDDEQQPFVLRRPAVEARAFEPRSNVRHLDRRLPGAQALHEAAAERDAHQDETIPATFDRAHADDWRPADPDDAFADAAASRGLHIDLLIDDGADAAASNDSPALRASPTSPDSTPLPALHPSPAPREPAVVPTRADDATAASSNSHVLGGTLTDGSLEEDIADAADPAPAFLRDTDRRHWHDTPRQRQWLIASAAAMAVLLCLQLVFHSRDVLAARYPAMSAPLAALCAVTGCTLGPPRRIDDVVVDSSALTRVEGLDAFQLTVVLRNRSTMTLAMPSIDLSLTDTDGQLVSRRALQPVDFASTSAALPASGEQTLKLLLSAGERRVTGYTVELFYP